jgi:hypothetical protein
MTATLTLDGKDVTGVTLSGVTITRGRTSIYDDVRPGVCTATLLSGDIDPEAWQGNSGYKDVYADIWAGGLEAARVGVALEVFSSSRTSGYTDVYSDQWDGLGNTRFTGTVTAVDYSPGVLVITAVDCVEQLGRVYYTAQRPEELDSSRAYVFALAAGVKLKTTGTVEATLLPVDAEADPIKVLDGILAAADSSDAQLYADRGNALYWRRRDTPPGPAVELDTGMTLSASLKVSQELGQIYNVERVAYGPSDNRNTYELVNQASIVKYGRREYKTYNTQLANYTDATALAQYWLAIDSAAAYTIGTVSVIIQPDETAWANIADQIDLYTPVTVPQLPTGSPIPSYSALVLGYTETITQQERTLELSLGPANYLMGN